MIALTVESTITHGLLRMLRPFTFPSVLHTQTSLLGAYKIKKKSCQSDDKIWKARKGMVFHFVHKEQNAMR